MNKYVAGQMYISHMKEIVVLTCVCICKRGFIIHSKLGWLGASPDGRVTDPSSQHVNGIVEFKVLQKICIIRIGLLLCIK